MRFLCSLAALALLALAAPQASAFGNHCHGCQQQAAVLVQPAPMLVQLPAVRLTYALAPAYAPAMYAPAATYYAPSYAALSYGGYGAGYVPAAAYYAPPTFALARPATMPSAEAADNDAALKRLVDESARSVKAIGQLTTLATQANDTLADHERRIRALEMKVGIGPK